MSKRLTGKSYAECEVDLCQSLIKRVSDRTPDFIERKSEHFIPVLVYGTLKSGGYFHDTLEGCPYLGDAYTTTPAFVLYDTGSFPVAFHIGEVYVVDPLTLLQLDRIESNGKMYSRKRITVKLIDQQGQANQFIQAWIYCGVDRYWAEDKYLKPCSMKSSSAGTVYDWDPRRSNLDDNIPF
jgi:gamma-glutamylcyclotransferase (GGCT)/AIG2-like uncharacterized protein YtfP